MQVSNLKDAWVSSSPDTKIISITEKKKNKLNILLNLVKV